MCTNRAEQKLLLLQSNSLRGSKNPFHALALLRKERIDQNVGFCGGLVVLSWFLLEKTGRKIQMSSFGTAT